MAELFGVAAGAAGFTSLLVQFVEAISTLKEIRRQVDKAPTDLNDVVKNLEFLVGIMSSAKELPSSQDSFLQYCRTSCDEVNRHIDRMNAKISPEAQSTKREKLRRVLEMRHWKEDIDDLKRSLEKAKADCGLYQMMVLQRSITDLQGLVLVHKAQLPPSSELGIMESTPAGLSAERTSLRRRAVTVRSNGESQIQRVPRPRRRVSCTIRHCPCRCHYRMGISRRFWALDYNPLVALRGGCDRKECDATEYGFNLRLALSQLGINWSITLGFQVQLVANSVGLRPNLQMERIVPYTSPGFELIWRCRNNLITYEEAKIGLVQLHQTDPTFKNHVSPDGESYIENLVRFPWHPGKMSEQYGLLALLMGELGMTHGTDTTRFLTHCAYWIDYGLHLQLLDLLVDLGFDTTVFDSPSAIAWPELCESFRNVEMMPDPFFIRYLKVLCKDNQGFGGLSPLHEAILGGSLEETRIWLSRSEKDENNFLGQTAVHLAVLQLDCLKLLIEAGYNLDQADIYGTTPAMYAAAMNQGDALVALLEAGANPYIRNKEDKHTFLQFAARGEHWDLIIRVLCFFEDVCQNETAKHFARMAIVLFFIDHGDYPVERHVLLRRQILAKCGDVNFLVDKNFSVDEDGEEESTLLHYTTTLSDLESLLENGFQLVNHRNRAGKTALMTLGGLERSGITRKLLEAGADINIRDNLGISALSYILRELDCHYRELDSIYRERVEILQLLSIYLTNGANSLSGDKCRCPCSPNGCYPAAPLWYPRYNSWRYFIFPIWYFEWLSILTEHRGSVEARHVLLSLIRRVKHEHFGMTHVCCHSKDREMSSEYIDRILADEFDLIGKLDTEMMEISDWDYELLLGYCIRQIKNSLRCALDEYEQKYMFSKRETTFQLKVDYKKDCFIGYFPFVPQEPRQYVINMLSEYILWLENEYYLGHYYHTSESARESGYHRRIGWLYRLIDGLEIQTEKIANKMRALVEHDRRYADYDKLEVEKGIKHFLQSLQDESCTVVESFDGD